jgi:hypothetical protein
MTYLYASSWGSAREFGIAHACADPSLPLRVSWEAPGGQRDPTVAEFAKNQGGVPVAECGKNSGEASWKSVYPPQPEVLATSATGESDRGAWDVVLVRGRRPADEPAQALGADGDARACPGLSVSSEHSI